MSQKENPLNYQQLKTIIESMSPEQQAMPVLWWGDERGGSVKSAAPLDEDYILGDEGYEPRSCYTDEDIQEYSMAEAPILSKGTLILWVD